ncbi:hypothetical protein [Streptomyces sp. NPDC048659]|uniref:hypothetical protein n=1 Tax=Streptomyces sp. NPDC048659 TaxID=3155489 RepID=UPI0034490767
MSAPDERATLTPRPAPLSLHAYVRARLDTEPGGRLPEHCYEPPDGAVRPDDPETEDDAEEPTYEEERAAVLAALEPPLAPPGTAPAASTAPASPTSPAHPAPPACPDRTTRILRDRLAELSAEDTTLCAAVADVPLPDEPTARALARRLVRTAPEMRSVLVGICLLRRLGEPEDVPYLSALGLLDGLTHPAVAALARLDVRAAALLRLACGAARSTHRALVDALASGDPRAAATAFAEQSPGRREQAPNGARSLAEAVGLAALLRAPRVDPRILVHAGRLLVRMGLPHDYACELLCYADAAEVVEAVVRRGCSLPPTVERAALLLALAQELHSGPAHLLPWREGQREQLLDALGALLTSPEWAAVPDRIRESAPPEERHRAAWLRATAERLFAPRPAAPPRLRIEVAAHDPVDRQYVETRFLIDGRPLVPEVFRRGAGLSPEELLGTGALVATEEPRQVLLAEAWCTEGCCGALRVTVVREGPEVVWRDWSHPVVLPGGEPPPPLPPYRFDAVAYDAELAREDPRGYAGDGPRHWI